MRLNQVKEANRLTNQLISLVKFQERVTSARDGKVSLSYTWGSGAGGEIRRANLFSTSVNDYITGEISTIRNSLLALGIELPTRLNISELERAFGRAAPAEDED